MNNKIRQNLRNFTVLQKVLRILINHKIILKVLLVLQISSHQHRNVIFILEKSLKKTLIIQNYKTLILKKKMNIWKKDKMIKIFKQMKLICSVNKILIRILEVNLIHGICHQVENIKIKRNKIMYKVNLYKNH